MTLIEAVAAGFGLLCVVLTIRQSIWCWPAGLIQVALYSIIFYQVKLYSDLILHVIYIGMQLYGWYHWLHGGEGRGELRVTSLSPRGRIAWPAAIAGVTCIWGYSMQTYTDADWPFGDAFTTVASLAAQWLMARKRLESWLYWIAVDVVAIGIYWQKSLYLTSALYTLFLILAMIGLSAWQRAMIAARSEPV